jgi:hypothetical protein
MGAAREVEHIPCRLMHPGKWRAPPRAALTLLQELRGSAQE